MRDHLGSIREMTDASGAVVARYDYDAWGRSTTVIGTTKPDFNFTALYNHAKSGLDMATYRFYDRDLGRWLSRDPIGESGGLNLYGYVGGNPVSMIDPLGLYWFRQPWQTDYVVGRPHTPVPPGGLISRLIENDVPAGRTFGEMHDSFVDAATRSGVPDWLANIPSMSYIYQEALVTELLRSLGILPQPTPPTQCK